MPKGFKITITKILLLSSIFLLNATKSSEPEIRVLLGELKEPIEIEARNLRCHSRWKTLNLNDRVQLSERHGKLWAQGKELGASITLTAQGVIYVNGKSYSGALLIKKIQEKYYIINQLGVEDYLAGVVRNEMASNWPLEALKAQSVLARTYALLRIQEPRSEHYDIFSTVEDQVYSGGISGEDPSLKAIKETSGQVLFYQNELANVYYHSCCGGWTEPVQYVWGGTGRPYLQAVKCDYCQECPYYFWRYPEKGALSPEELASRLGYKGEAVKEVLISELSPGQRVVKMELKFQSGDKTTISGADFRVRLGREQIRSTLFKVEKTRDGFIIFGSGSGHGVGLCQWGAKGMADAGKSYQEILEHYFPGTKIKKAY